MNQCNVQQLKTNDKNGFNATTILPAVVDSTTGRSAETSGTDTQMLHRSLTDLGHILETIKDIQTKQVSLLI